MDTLLDTLDRHHHEMFQVNHEDEAFKNLGTIIDCARQDLEDPENDVDARRYVEFQIDEYPALDDHRETIMAILRR